MTKDINGLPLYVFILIGMVLLAQGTWLFLDAKKRDANAWFWGIWGLIQAPWPFILYWLFVRIRIHKRRGKR